MPLFVVGQLLGFVLGFLSCFAFWSAMQWLKPDLRVAPSVAFDPETGLLGIKVVNWSRRKATNIEVHVATASRPTGRTMTTRKIATLRWSTVLALDSKQNLDKNPWGLPTCFTFVAHNASEMLDDLHESPQDRRLVLTITARDAWSGTAAVQRVAFPVTAVCSGWYKRGLSFEISPHDAQTGESSGSPDPEQSATT